MAIFLAIAVFALVVMVLAGFALASGSLLLRLLRAPAAPAAAPVPDVRPRAPTPEQGGFAAFSRRVAPR